MQFVNRTTALNAPIAILLTLHQEEQPKWLAYKAWITSKVGPQVNKPASRWTADSIRQPLSNLFNNNCGYCGNYSDMANDGEVDHFLPNEKDPTAQSTYLWDNYVWSCHPCNNRKRDNYPILNPCSLQEMGEIFFHSYDGRYLVKQTAPTLTKDKFKLTELKTFLNGKKNPERRKLLHNQLMNIYLPRLADCDEDYTLKLSNNPNSAETHESLQRLESAKQELKDVIATCEFFRLKELIFSRFKAQRISFSFVFADFT